MVKRLTILLLLCFCTNVFAQEPIRYTTKQGLPSNHIYDIQEDADGFMWFATNRGLVKYDGETFKTFTIQDGLPNNDTWLLDLDLQGRLWYFSKSSYQGYIKNDSIYKFQTKDKKVHSPGSISKNKEMLWFYSSSGAFTLKDGVLVNIYPNVNDFLSKSIEIAKQEGREPNEITNVFDPISKQIIYLLKDKFLVYDSDFNLKEEIPNTSLIDFTEEYVSSGGILPNNLFYQASKTNLNFFNITTKQAISFDFKTIDKTVKSTDYLKCKAVKNEIQVSIPGHLFIFNYNLELINTYSFSIHKENVGSYKDSKGNIWLRNFTNGITLLPNSQLQSQYYLKDKKVQKVTAIDNTLFIGIQRKGFYKLNKQTNTIETIIEIKNPHAEVYQIKKDPISKQIKLITGADSYDYKTLKRIKIKRDDYSGKTHRFQFKNEMGFFKDITLFNNYEYYNHGKGVFKANLITKKWKDVALKEGLITSDIYKNKLFYGGSDGLHEMVNDTLIRPITSEFTTLPINSLTATTKYLLVGTNGRGVYIYNEKEVLHLKNTDGLSVQRILT